MLSLLHLQLQLSTLNTDKNTNEIKELGNTYTKIYILYILYINI